MEFKESRLLNLRRLGSSRKGTLRLLNALNSEDRGLKVRFSLATIVFETFELILCQLLSSQGKNAPSNPYPHYLVRLATSRKFLLLAKRTLTGCKAFRGFRARVSGSRKATEPEIDERTRKGSNVTKLSEVIGTEKTMTARDVAGFYVFSPPGNRAIFSTFCLVNLSSLN